MTSAPGYEIVFTARERAELLPLPADPPPPADDELTGRTLATAISPGTELALYASEDPATFPLRPGYAAVFEVEAVGAAVEGFAVGDRVFCMGQHRSRQRQRHQNVVKVPAHLPAEEAVFARLMSVSMTTLVTTAARPGQIVLVTGLGPIGHLAAKLFAAGGYRVIGCDPVAARRDLLAGINGITTSPTVVVADPAVAGQVALVVECSGHEQATLDGCRMVRKGGEVVLVGVPWRRRADDLYAHDILHAVFHRYAVLRSGWEWELPRHDEEFRPSSIQANLALAIDWLAQGRVTLDGLFETASPTYPQEVYAALLQQRTARPAVAIDWTAADAA